jgi:hypothetical protein
MQPTWVRPHPLLDEMAVYRDCVMNHRKHLDMLTCANATVYQNVLNNFVIWDINNFKWGCSITLTQVCSHSFLAVMAVCRNFVTNRWRHLNMSTCTNAIVLQNVLNNLEIRNIHKRKWEGSTTLKHVRPHSLLTKMAGCHNFVMNCQRHI